MGYMLDDIYSELVRAMNWSFTPEQWSQAEQNLCITQLSLPATMTEQ